MHTSLRLKTISVYELSTGMILAENLLLNGINLLSKDTKLDNAKIEKIITLSPVSFISVYMQQDELSQYLDDRNIKFKEVEKTLHKFSNNTQSIINSIGYNSKIDVNNLRNTTKELLTDIDDYSSMLKSIVNSRTVDEYLVRHSLNVALLSSMLGKWLNLPEKDILLLTYSGLLHDIGKILIDQKIINKPSKLNNTEFNIIKKHPIIAYEIVKKMPYFDSNVSMAILMHHERINGSGYPLGIKDEQINLYAKIIGIVDVFDAITSNKVYAKKKNPFKALEILQHEYLGLLDSRCLNTFITQMINYYTGEMVELSDGTIGKIMKIDINNISTPLILVGSDFIDLNKEKSLYIEDLL